jgi:hypothetical protein
MFKIIWVALSSSLSTIAAPTTNGNSKVSPPSMLLYTTLPAPKYARHTGNVIWVYIPTSESKHPDG